MSRKGNGIFTWLTRRLRRKARLSSNERTTEQYPGKHDDPIAPIAEPQGFLSREPASVETDQPCSTKRQMWIGVDYGTSRSKLVLTDYDAQDRNISFPVRPPQERGGDGGYCIPSTVTINGGFIRFGFDAEAQAGDGERVYRSLKMLCAYPDQFYGDRAELPFRGMNARDLATLYVGYLVQLGQDAAVRYSNRFQAEPSFGVTVGAPMAQLDDTELQATFVEIAREAFTLRNRVDLLNGVSVEVAKSTLATARNELAGSSLAEPRDWVRSEAEAALFWAYTSPDIREGRYACVDVGAGTTSASWFHITAVRSGELLVNNRLVFWGNACAPPGCDAIDKLLADYLEYPTIAEARGRENLLIEEQLNGQFENQYTQVLDQIAYVLQCASVDAFDKDRSELRWNRIGQMFFLGGGNKINSVRERLIDHRRVWLNEYEPHADPGAPPDLVEENGTEIEEDPVFLLVAYGLARRLGDVPDIISSSAVPVSTPYTRTRRLPSSDELYSD